MLQAERYHVTYELFLRRKWGVGKEERKREKKRLNLNLTNLCT